ncbi:MAG: rod shape-determining protein MreD [Chlorobium sp.]|nr:MAG: rod shape-determining protein MreD [Chlorobium sp.]
MLGIVPLVQEFGLSRLSLFGVSPDAITIYLAFIALIAGQRSSTSFGFASGIIIGILSGNIGLNMLVRTIEGFIAGYFHIPDSSHSTTKQKTRRIYGAVVMAGFCGNAVFAIGYNPLALSPLYRIAVLGVLESFLTLILAVILNWLFLRKSLAD